MYTNMNNKVRIAVSPSLHTCTMSSLSPQMHAFLGAVTLQRIIEHMQCACEHFRKKLRIRIIVECFNPSHRRQSYKLINNFVRNFA